MITNHDINEEITKVDEQVASKIIKDPYQIANLKFLSLIIKLVMSIRTNQTLIMGKMGVKKIEPQLRKEDETNVQKE